MIIPEVGKRWESLVDRQIACLYHAEKFWEEEGKERWIQITDEELLAFIEGTGWPMPCLYCEIQNQPDYQKKEKEVQK